MRAPGSKYQYDSSMDPNVLTPSISLTQPPGSPGSATTLLSSTRRSSFSSPTSDDGTEELDEVDLITFAPQTRPEIPQLDSDEGEFSDVDSAFCGSFVGRDTDFLTNLFTDYKIENGRRYHAYGEDPYWGPNDERANDVQDLTHLLYLRTLNGRLHLAPIKTPHNILDLGTGTGLWAIDMADQYPSAKVIGTDLSPIQATLIPPNLEFEMEDFNFRWTYPMDTYDFIHMRDLSGCIKNWDEFFSRVYERTKPGGYAEIVEHSVCPVSDDGTVSESGFLNVWGKTAIEMGEKSGKSFDLCAESATCLHTAGFINIIKKRYKWPLNGWPSQSCMISDDDGKKSWKEMRELGRWNHARMHDGIEGFMIRLLTSAGGWTYEDTQLFFAKMRSELRDSNIHAYLDVTVVYGRRPDFSLD